MANQNRSRAVKKGASSAPRSAAGKKLVRDWSGPELERILAEAAEYRAAEPVSDSERSGMREVVERLLNNGNSVRAIRAFCLERNGEVSEKFIRRIRARLADQASSGGTAGSSASAPQAASLKKGEGRGSASSMDEGA